MQMIQIHIAHMVAQIGKSVRHSQTLRARIHIIIATKASLMLLLLLLLLLCWLQDMRATVMRLTMMIVVMQTVMVWLQMQRVIIMMRKVMKRPARMRHLLLRRLLILTVVAAVAMRVHLLASFIQRGVALHQIDDALLAAADSALLRAASLIRRTALGRYVLDILRIPHGLGIVRGIVVEHERRVHARRAGRDCRARLRGRHLLGRGELRGRRAHETRVRVRRWVVGRGGGQRGRRVRPIERVTQIVVQVTIHVSHGTNDNSRLNL
jgi:hypothetical protein